MQFFVVFALAAVACASPAVLGSWQLTDAGWQWLPLKTPDVSGSTVDESNVASKTNVSNEVVTSLPADANATTIINAGVTFNATVPTVAALPEGTTALPIVDANANITTMAPSANIVLNDSLIVLNSTATVAPIVIMGNSLEGETTKQPEMLNTTVLTVITTVASIAGMPSQLIVNESALNTTMAPITTIKFGNEIDSATTAFNASAPIVANATAINETAVNTTTTTMASTAAIKFGNNVDDANTTLNATVSNTTIAAVSTTPISNISTSPINETTTVQFSNTTVISNATTLAPTTTMNLGANMDNSTSAMLNATAVNTTVALGNDIDGVATESTLNATASNATTFNATAFNETSTISGMFNETTTVMAETTVKFGDNVDSMVAVKVAEEITTAASVQKEIKPNTCAISDHASDHADCRRRADGDFFRNAKDCSKYFRCAHGLRMECACPTGTVFNELTTVCDYEWAVPECNADPQAWQPQLVSSTEIAEPAVSAEITEPAEIPSSDM